MFAFTKTSLAVLALASFSRAVLTIQPFNLVPNTTNTVSWSSSDIDKDPASFTIELINEVFHSQFALANNVLTTSGSASFQLPAVLPGDGFTLQFVEVGNINNVFANSSTFSIAQHNAGDPVPSGPAASGVKISTTATPSTTSSVPATVTQSSPSTIRTPPSVSATTTLTTPTGSATTGTAASAGAASPSPSSAAIALVPASSFAVLVAGLLALAF